jgi:L-alanine-DL-glutamate epimerase-like enolase superfamily enzyme
VVLKYRIHPHQVSLSRRRQQTLCKLAAQASAASRRTANADSLNAIDEITPAVIAALGVTEARQQADLASEYRHWINIMSTAGEYRVALKATMAALRSDRSRAARSQIADLHFGAAKFNWQKKRFWKSFLAASNALLSHPVMARRFMKPMLQRLGFGLKAR